MTNLRRELGFWTSLGRLRFSTIVRTEFLGAVIVGIGGGAALTKVTTPAQRVGVVGDFLPLAVALLAIVFAAFALIVSLMNDDHLRRLRQAEGGVRVFLSPFIISIGVFIAMLIGSVAYRAVVPHIPSAVERWFFVALCFLFIFTVLDLMALARNVFAHALLRERSQELNELPNITQRRHPDEGRG